MAEVSAQMSTGLLDCGTSRFGKMARQGLVVRASRRSRPCRPPNGRPQAAGAGDLTMADGEIELMLVRVPDVQARLGIRELFKARGTYHDGNK